MAPIRYRRYAAILVAVIVMGVTALMATAAPADSAEEVEHTSGISLVGPGPYQPQPANEAQAMALHKARRIARANPDDFGYPSLDEHGSLMQRYVTQKGLILSRAVDAAVPRRQENTVRSYGQLEAIKHEITRLAKAGVPDADTIWRTSPDYKHNRIIVTVTRLSDDLMTALAELYGTEVIAVRVEPIGQRVRLMAGRQSDSIPFAGGSRFLNDRGAGCTLGFPWTTGIITAGHCLPQGGNSTSPTNGTIGVTQESVDENYNDGTGTVPFPGKTELRGDIALIRTPDKSWTRPEIYVGDKYSYTTRSVTDMWDRSPLAGDRYCTGGSITGQLCGWEVTDIDADVNTDFPNEWTYNVIEGKRTGGGTEGGDSGGPVYTYRTDGTIAAKGIHNAGRVFLTTHYSYFTDIWDAYDSFPGFLKTPAAITPYSIRNGNSGKCLAIGNSSKANGANAIQWDCLSNSLGQTWYLAPHPSAPPWLRITNGSGKCLAIGSSSTANGAEAIQWDCYDNSVGQRWYFGMNDSLVNGSGKCLAIGSGSLANGAKAIQWDCIGSPAQNWIWTPR